VNALAGLGWLYSSETRVAAWLGFFVRHMLTTLLSRDRVIVQNPDDRAWLLDLGLPKKLIHLIRGSGVDTRQFSPHPFVKDIPVVMLVARMLWDKGIGEFVNAAKEIQRNGGRARFVLVGAPDPENPASISESQLREWALEGTVEWWGRRDDMTAV